MDATRDSQDEHDRADAARSLAGDREAFRAIVERHQDRVFNLVLRLVGNREDALELAQDAFLRAHEKLHQYRRELPLRNWLYRIAQNLALVRLRRRGPETESGADELPASGPGPEEAASRNEELAHVERCLATLPEKYRSALLLRHQEGCSLAEIAYVLDVPLGTVKFRLHQGYLLLRGRLRLSEAP